MKPLEGITVIDMTRVLAGPYCTMLMRELGARIIKIERPDGGDDSRDFGPFIDGDKTRSAYFSSINWGKESICLDLKKPRAREILFDLIKKADVLVENFRPGTMEKLGLGYTELKKINSKLIYAAASGFGHYGPYSTKAAYDMIIQAMSGLMSITGAPGYPPVRVGISIADIATGMFCALGVVSALYKRNETGKGTKVDVAMLDSMVSMLENALVRFSVGKENPGPLGTRHPSITPFQAFETADSHIIVAVGNDKLWKTFCGALDREDLMTDEKYATNDLRTRCHNTLEKELAVVFPAKTTAEWIELLDPLGVPCAKINDISDLAADPHIKARNMLLHLTGEKDILIAGDPIKFPEEDEPGRQPTTRPPAPRLGEHTADVLTELLSLSPEEIEVLSNDGVI